jgi:hypothetical protein
MKTKRKLFRVIRVRDGAVVGEHISKELAIKRLRRLVSMSNGRLEESSFRVERATP